MSAVLHEVKPAADRVQRLRRIAGRSLRSALACHGAELAGFALVSWDQRGDAHSAYYTATGPVGRALLPSYVHDALNRHVAVEQAHEAQSYTIEGA